MKKLFFILSVFFSAFSFISVMPPGWYQQSLPVNDFINDIYFTDTLNGWIVTEGKFNTNDTSYILRTTNGGDNWIIQNIKVEQLNVIQFIDINTGYAGGGRNGTISVSFYKTTNGGTNWIALNSLNGVAIEDMYFLNKDTGWVCDNNALNGGVFKTTNGGINWVQQLNQTYTPLKIHFINKDTGWVGTSDKKLYRTLNGGANWTLQYTFSQQINDVYFLNSQKGWVSSLINYYTTNGGNNWVASNTNVGGVELSFVSDTLGWAGSNFNKISKTTNGGVSWFYQPAPLFTAFSVCAINDSTVWAGGSGIMKTTDGGGMTGVVQTGNEIPEDFTLSQNYPNPFNPETIINYELRITGNVKLIIYDINGKVIHEAVNKKQSAGSYQYTFDGSGLTSGVYFYTLQTDNFSDTKKMLLIK